MKILFIRFSIAVSLLGAAAGCGKTETTPDNATSIPLRPVIYYDLMEGTGPTSWFSNPDSVPKDSVVLQATNADGSIRRETPSFVPLRGRLCFKDRVDGFTAEPQPTNSSAFINQRFIYLGKRDVDTLRLEILPKSLRSASDIEKLSVFYNNRLSASYDFQRNPNLRDSLICTGMPGLIVPLHKFSRR